MQTFKTPNGNVCYQREHLPAKSRHRDPTLPKLAIQVRLLETTVTQQCILHHREEVNQKKMSIQLSVHHRCCNGMFCQRRSVESLLAAYWGTTPAKAPETRRVSNVIIQTHNWWSSKKEDLESFWWGIQQERALQKALCKNAAGAQGIQEPSMSFTWPLSTHGDWWVWYLDGSPQNERKVIFLCMCSSGYFPHGFLSPSNSQLTA